jgi:proteasome lid subunit RPN8/RPN11
MATPSPAAGRRRLLLQVLERHTQSPAAAAPVRAAGVRLRDETLRDKVERGALLDVETGEQVGEVVVGTAEAVEAGPLLRLMRPGRRYVFVHSHPDGRSFSQADVAGLVAHWPLLCAVVAIGAQGTWYVVSVAPGLEAPPPADVGAAFRQEREALAPTYQELVQRGALPRREAQRQLTHEVWERIAPGLGLRYDRV